MRNTKDETVTRFSVSLPSTLARALDRMAREKGYDNRSLAVADMIRANLVEHRQQNDAAEIAGSITLVYDHHRHHLLDLLTAGIVTALFPSLISGMPAVEWAVQSIVTGLPGVAIMVLITCLALKFYPPASGGSGPATA